VNPDKPLPLNRKPVEDFEMGHQEPDPNKVSRGKCTLRQAIKFISDHQTTPNEWTAERISNEYKLKRENVDDILANFRMFAVEIPKAKEMKSRQLLFDPLRRDIGFNEFAESARGTAHKKINQGKSEQDPKEKEEKKAQQ